MKRITTRLNYLIVFLAILSVIVYLFFGKKLFFAGVLLTGYYITGIIAMVIFFLTAHFLSGTTWWQYFTDAMMSTGRWIYYPALVLIILLFTGINELYPWADAEVYSDFHTFKRLVFSITFFTGRSLFFLLILPGATFYSIHRIRKCFNTDCLLHIREAKTASALYIIALVIAITFLSWDLILSLNPEFISTIFGLYNFISLLAGGISLLVLYLILAGYLKPGLAADCVQSVYLSRYLFSFALIWIYLWYSQYLITWYGNIPEEYTFYIRRLNFSAVLFYGNVVLNFVVPFTLLLSEKAKSSPVTLLIVSICGVLGHWVDFYLLVIPELADFNPALFSILLLVLITTGICFFARTMVYSDKKEIRDIKVTL